MRKGQLQYVCFNNNVIGAIESSGMFVRVTVREVNKPQGDFTMRERFALQFNRTAVL